MGDPSAPPQSDKIAQLAKKRVNRQIGDSSAPQHKEKNMQPTKKRVNRVIGDSSAPPQSEINTQRKVSIFVDHWDLVSETVKDQI